MLLINHKKLHLKALMLDSKETIIFYTIKM